MNELLCIVIFLIMIAIFASFDKSGKQGFKRSPKYRYTKTLSSMKRALSDSYEAPWPAFEPSIHDGINYPGGYRAYLQSAEWKMKREVVLQRDGYICLDCLSVEFLEVHHLNYFFLFREEENEYRDLVVLCRTCHQSRHDNDHELFTYKGQL